MSELWDLIDENLQQVAEPQEIGASTATPPAVHGESDPGDIYRYGPNFVRFVHVLNVSIHFHFHICRLTFCSGSTILIFTRPRTSTNFVAILKKLNKKFFD